MGTTHARSSAMKRTAGRSLARLIRLTERTSRIIMDPPSLKADVRAAHPVIVATWHGQFMMTVHLNAPDVRVAAMVARHGDAELIGEAMAAFGVELIRGAGAGERRKDRGGVHALRAAVAALTGQDGRSGPGGTHDQPASLVMTADVPPGPARRCGEGIITIARLSGRPIIPVASATSRYMAFKTWSRVTVNLPFSTLAFAAGAPIHVPRDADAATLERLRCELEASLNAATARAYHLAGADPARATPPNPASPPPAAGLLLKTYTGALSAARPLFGPLLRQRLKQGKEDAVRIGERRGIAGIARPAGPIAWFHAASVGETNAVLPLIDAVMKARPDVRPLLTTTTVTSAAVAANRLPAGAVHQFVPLDAPEYARRFLDHWQPDLAVFTESEIWPSLILETAKRSIPLALVNARMSDKSYKRWKRLPGMAAPLFGRFTVILAQNAMLARWFRACGGRNVIAAGNLKADAPPPPVDAVQRAALDAALGGRPRFLAASTHEGEERIIAEAHKLIAAALPGFCTIIAPRHPERGSAIAREISALGLRVAQRSMQQALDASTDIYIADTIGELGTLFACAPVSFIGGSLIERGGQNPLEPVSLGSAVLSGPSRHNFADAYDALAKANGMIEVTDASQIAASVVGLLGDPAGLAALDARASAAVADLKGALPRTLAAILPLLPPPAPAKVPADMSISSAS